ncbi:spore germination protein GerPC [Halobacillus locisalis]|nr:spore germination protein GerPC [Halobacillus locisalis]
MNNYYSWQSYIQQMMKQLEQQQQIIQQLQKQVESLTSNEKPQTVIEKIEYHFDQLKIETLEGTLQIGLTPNGSDLSDIGDLYSKQANQHQQPLLHSLQQYMTSEVPDWMDQYVRDHDIRLEDQHKQQILADVRKQLPDRVHMYKEQHPDMDETALLHQIQTEIRNSMAAYFDTLEGED